LVWLTAPWKAMTATLAGPAGPGAAADEVGAGKV
jgi:hypothetical protein